MCGRFVNSDVRSLGWVKLAEVCDKIIGGW